MVARVFRRKRLVRAGADGLPAGWWSPGDGRALPACAEYDNAFGKLGTVNANGAIETDGHPFFEPLGAIRSLPQSTE